MTGIAVTLSEVPADVIGQYRLDGRVCDRFGHKELQFHWWQTPALLPVRWEGRWRALRWGSKDRRSRLPYGGWVSLEQLESGLLAHVRPESVVIPATMGHHRGTWFVIESGVRGLVLPHAPGGPVVYVLTKPSTNYYRNMTGQEPMMPALVDQVI